MREAGEMSERFLRTMALTGEAGVEALGQASVAVFGIGGVGGYAAEAIARSGAGNITLIDCDSVAESNINRQIIAKSDTVGMRKTEVMRERIMQINPEARVNAIDMLYLPENADAIDLAAFDWVIDAVDNVSAKLELAVRADKCGTKLISCMGTGNKLHPELLRVADIYDTSVCPLARVMRRELKKRGVERLRVVYSTEEPVRTGTRTPSSMVFVPAAAGMLMASVVVRDIIGAK